MMNGWKYKEGPALDSVVRTGLRAGTLHLTSEYAVPAIRPSPKLKLTKKLRRTVGFAHWQNTPLAALQLQHIPGR
jgi:hypothetical protein